MEVVPIRIPRPNSPTRAAALPFNRRNVEEWSRIDKLTGITETAKIETDHWAARTSNAAHNYGKVIDSRERNNFDGSLQERQRKQMEVFQTKVPGGSMQVIRTQTITTSSKKWTTSSNEKGFEDLELPVNSLDLSSQKTKGSVGRSGSIGGRRPPTRPRSLINQSSSTKIFGEESSVSKMCQRLHEQVKNEMLSGLSDFSNNNHSFNGSNVDDDSSGVVITDVTNLTQNEDVVKQCLSRQKSCSNENLTAETDNENVLRRSSKIRRSLQCHKQNQDCDSEDFDWSTTKSLKERAAEIENLLRHGRSSSYSSQTPSDKSSDSYGKMKILKTKDSFVSAETLKEVRDRLKKLNSSDSETKDDGIVTEKDASSPIKCFDQETMVNGTNKKFNLNGTGSLESRYSNKNSSTGSRSSEWYKRRKSYGFEQVDEYDKFDKFKNKKNQIDSSTDSGIWQSSETMGIPSWNRNADSSVYWEKTNSDYFSNPKKTSTPKVVTVRVQKDPSDTLKSSLFNQSTNLYEKAANSIYLDNPSDTSFLAPLKNFKAEEKAEMIKNHYKDDSLPYESAWNRKSPIPVLKANVARENLTSTLMSAKNPWIMQLRGTKLVDRNWASDEQDDLEINKRHSDGSDKQSPTLFCKENGVKSDGEGLSQKKSKKVEFCKTEVHFAAESGKFNIVETDGKPPPNDIFRRRRRNGPASPKNPNDLPEIKFGDSSFEKSLMSSAEKTESISEKIEAELKELSRIVIEALPKSEEWEKNAVEYKKPSSWLYDVAEEPSENDQSDNIKPKSILKNYRKSFLLGESEMNNLTPPGVQNNNLKNHCQDTAPSWKSNTSDNLKNHCQETTPVWKSTVVLRNKRFDDLRNKNEDDRKLCASDGETELQIRIRNLRKTEPANRKLWEKPTMNTNYISEESKRRSLPDDILLKNSINLFSNNLSKSSISIDEMPSLSVAERVKQVEEMKSNNNYSTKINFRSGEMTVIQNGNGKEFMEEPGKTQTSWTNQKKPISRDTTSLFAKDTNKTPMLSCDKLATSNPSVMRFSAQDDKTDSQKYQTTRILINFETMDKREPSQSGVTSSTENINKNNNNKLSERSINTYGSWSSGMKKNFGRYLNELKSVAAVKDISSQAPENQSEFPPKEDIPKPSKPVHEIIDQFDSLSQKCWKEKIRKPIPTTYKPAKEYTHSDLEEELKNFTENLDKDFKDIYEEEIGILRKWKSMRETKSSSHESTSKTENLVRPVLLHRPTNYYQGKSSSDEGSKKSSLLTSSRDNYDTDDSDLLADEEVRSYMSTGHGGSESETEGAYASSTSRKSFQESILRFKKLKSNLKGEKEFKNNPEPIQAGTIYTEKKKVFEQNGEPTRVASIALKYEDDPKFNKRTYQDILLVPKPCHSKARANGLNAEPWDGVTNSSSLSNDKPRERVSYLNGLSLSEKYSKFQRSSNSSLETASETNAERILSRRRISDELDNKQEAYKLGSKSESEINYRKQKTHSQYMSNTHHKTDQVVGSKKEEKRMVEEQKHSNYPYKNDYVESSRYRVKPTPGKTTSRKSQEEKYHKQSSSYGKEKEKKQTDESMLEELKRAADQILQAVNGYTDDSSHLGSSEDDDRSRRIIRKDKINTLGTISEGKRVAKTETRKAVATSTHRRTGGNQSSASSLESLTKESTRTVRDVKSSTRHRHSDPSKTSSRTTRLLQRESSREALMPQPSSSEDIPSYLEQAKKRVLRRQRSGSSAKAEVATDGKTMSSRSKSRSTGAESSSTSRIRERKSEKVKESLSTTKSSRSNHAANESERTKSSSTRRSVVDKSEVESNRRKRSQHTSSRGEHGSSHSSRRKATVIKKADGYMALQPT